MLGGGTLMVKSALLMSKIAGLEMLTTLILAWVVAGPATFQF